MNSHKSILPLCKIRKYHCIVIEIFIVEQRVEMDWLWWAQDAKWTVYSGIERWNGPVIEG